MMIPICDFTNQSSMKFLCDLSLVQFLLNVGQILCQETDLDDLICQ